MSKTNFSDLIKKATSGNNTKVIQKVTPVKQKNKDEIQFSFYIEKQLLKQVKLMAIERNVSIKNIINTAIKNELKQDDN